MEEIEISTISNSESNLSIRIRDAYKQYSETNVVLNGLNLTVSEGTIYGLLGPSGCGKTTLLNCIIGQAELDMGSIRISIKNRSGIGFMPQTVSLYNELSILENFLIFGYLFGMTTKSIETRSADLISFLNIPPGNRSVNSLSQGQQRRVSIAITFLHDPKILILDEPTVGLDPILCQSIWERLIDMAKNGKTILITTHYIQEAAQAHKVGLMMEGKILVEENPAFLLEKYNCSNLEDVFLKIVCDDRNKNEQKHFNHPKLSKTFKVQFEDNDNFLSKKKFKGLSYKNWITLRRGYIFILFSLIMPPIQNYLFNIALTEKPKDLSLAVVNEEISVKDCDFHAYNGCFLENINVSLSCLYLKLIENEHYKLIEYSALADAMKDLKRNKVYSLLYFSHNFTNSLAYKILHGVSLKKADNINNSFVQIWIDSTDRYIYEFIKYDVDRAMTLLLQKSTKKCGIDSRIAKIPIKFEKPIRGDVEETTNSYVSTALLCLTVFLFPSVSTTMLIIQEKITGLVERIMVTGASLNDILLSFFILQWILNILQIISLMVIVYIVFDNPLEGSLITLFMLMVITGICGILLGFILAMISSNITAAAYSGVGLNFLLSISSGLFGPREAEHKILKFISSFLPGTWTVEAARSISNKGSSFSHPDVFRGFYTTLAWILFFIGIIIYFLRYKKEKILHKN